MMRRTLYLILLFGFNAHANMPTLKPPAEAVRDCIDGYIVIDFFVIAGQPIDMQITKSEPNGLYTAAFLDWWKKYDSWRRDMGIRLSGEADDNQRKEMTFSYDQCAAE